MPTAQQMALAFGSLMMRVMAIRVAMLMSDTHADVLRAVKELLVTEQTRVGRDCEEMF